MCTVSVNVDENVLRGVNPNLASVTAIREWVQQLIDVRIHEMLDEDTEVMDIEEAQTMVHETIHKEYAQL